ncbi:MAG: acyl-CoA dehydrogenase family protein, partial [Pseudomonadota bacterium]
THLVTNQVPAFAGRNLFDSDPLVEGLARTAFGANEIDGFFDHGRICGAAESFEMARMANKNPPVIRTFDPQGNRFDQVDYHPSYHALMRRSIEAGLHSSIWEDDGAFAGRRHLARAIRFYMSAQTENGHLCPVTMTSAAIAALAHAPDLVSFWAQRALMRRYDHRFLPPDRKAGITLGMGMTEKQGGTDVRSNATYAERIDGDLWRIVGHKWFLSAPMCDAFLVLAQTGEGPTCFLVPRHMPDRTVNGLRLQRLKDKLGNRSNASSEVEFHDASGFLVGDPGAGIRTILEMVTLTRLDCAVSSAGLMRFGLASAVHHARHRKAFGGPLFDKPLMRTVLGDMALDSAAATALVMRLAHAFDRRNLDGREAAYARLMTPAIKYWVCKITPPLVTEALECHGGNGYVEEGDLARLYREAPLNSIWEGSGNVMCLDVLRVLERHPDALEAVITLIEDDFGAERRSLVDVLAKLGTAALEDPATARVLTEQLALTGAAAALNGTAPGLLAESFLVSRLGGQWRSTYGMLDSRFDGAALTDAVCPEV